MNALKILFLNCCVLFFISACSDDPSTVEEKPLFDFLNQSGISIDTVRSAGSVWEYGFRVKTLEAGKITKLGIKVPAINSFKVKLYDLNTQAILSQATISSTEEGGEFFADIADVHVTKDADLGVAIVADVFFRVRNISGEAINFPLTKDHLNIISFNEGLCGPNGCTTFPTSTNSVIIAPCVNLVFVKD